MSKRTGIDKGAPSVTQDNELIRAAYTLTPLEKRLLLVGMSKLNPTVPVERGRPPVDRLTITADDWRQAFPDDPKPYRSLRAACDGLLSRQWRVDHEGEGVYTKYNWLSRCSYNKSKGVVEMVFTHDTSLRLHGMFQNFTTLQLHQIGQLKSFNQIRLYELLCQFRPTGFLTITLAELREILGLGDKHSRWSYFKRDVLDPSVKAITKETDLTVTYKPIKEVRKIVGVEFVFRVDQQQELPLPDPEK